MLTVPDKMQHWWAPAGSTLPFCTIDLRPGGELRYCTRSPDGTETWTRGVYIEVTPPQRITYAETTTDKDGNPVTDSTYLSPDRDTWPEHRHVTFNLATLGTQTLLEVHQKGIPDHTTETARQSWTSMLSRLADQLK